MTAEQAECPSEIAARPRNPRWRPLWGLSLLYGACGAYAFWLHAAGSIGNHRTWAGFALFGYCAALLLAAAGLGRLAIVGAACAAVAAPISYLVATGRAQDEIFVVEHSASLLLNTGSPYLTDPARLLDINPYLPAMALFGLPRALATSDLADPRLLLALSCLGALYAAFRIRRFSDQLFTLLFLVGLPPVALATSVGSTDLPVVGLLVLSLATIEVGKYRTSALVGGAALALKWTAWPLLMVGAAFVGVRAGRGRTLSRWILTASSIGVVTVFLGAVVGGRQFWQQVVAFPAGMGQISSPAESPFPGVLVSEHLRHGRSLALGAVAICALAITAWLLVRPPRSLRSAHTVLAVGLSAAILLAPQSRFGYVVYPLILLLTRAPVRLPGRRPPPRVKSKRACPHTPY